MFTIHKGPFMDKKDNQFAYMLPDGKHMIQVFIWRNCATCCVMNATTFKHMQDITFYFETCPKWQDMINAFEELAIRKYPAEIRHKSRG